MDENGSSCYRANK
ncbi:hypothetical protein AYI69_g10123, partial [Smittium culicis]